MMKRKILLFVIALMIPQMMKAQGTDQFFNIHGRDSNPYITPETKAEDIIGYILMGPGGEDYMLKTGTWLELQRWETDVFGNVHVTYNQKTDKELFSDYQLVLHFHPDGSLYYKNGVIILEKKDAQQAKALNPANRITAERAAIIATGSPLSETMWTFANYRNTPREAYKVKDAGRMQYVYVDAYSGEVLYTIPIMHSYAPWSKVQGNAVTMTANTSYNGLQTLTMMQTDKGYILRDPLRNIVTVDATDVYGDKQPEFTAGDDGFEIFTEACDDASFVSEEDLLNLKYATGLRGVTVWLDPTIKEAPKSLNLTVYYANDKFESIATIIDKDFDDVVWTADGCQLKTTLTLSPIPEIDLVNYHHLEVVTIDGKRYFNGDGMAAGNRKTAMLPFEGGGMQLDCFFDVMTDARQPSVDVHWSIQKVYDMYYEYYGIKGCDGKGSQIVNIVNPGNNVLRLEKTFPFNACALGEEKKDCNEEPSYVMLYGMGGVHATKPMTAFDVTAHEFTHNVTAGCCNNLLYQNESGALNEALADCMAMLAEDYLYGTPTWTLGEDIMVYSDNMRSCSDPWFSGCVDGTIVEGRAQPKYYWGRFWFDYITNPPTEVNDYGGVHRNSGVFNYLFYLLCEGGNGLTNEVGKTTDITPVGIGKMKDIIFHTMRYYDSSLCNYKEIADNLLMAIEDIYGTDVETVSDLQNKMLQAYEFVGMESEMFPTGISLSQKDIKAVNHRTYNLLGIPVGDDYKGIVIKNGKKVARN